ncbi:MAG: hypothetical protein A4S09_07410 [Proteobacteria bacterium SG_bin7]|nr:MAG: hypothetical protein A4S09_07410 [Proteobacteria bacterium SG_bin7]
MRIVLIAALTLTCLNSVAKTICASKGKFRYIEGKSAVIKTMDYCYDSNKNQLISKTCDKKCVAKEERFLPDSLEFLDLEYGDPLFSYCYLFNGIPSRIEYLWNNQWRETSICTFEDNSFVNLSYLYREGISFMSISESSTEDM